MCFPGVSFGTFLVHHMWRGEHFVVSMSLNWHWLGVDAHSPFTFLERLCHNLTSIQYAQMPYSDTRTQMKSPLLVLLSTDTYPKKFPYRKFQYPFPVWVRLVAIPAKDVSSNCDRKFVTVKVPIWRVYSILYYRSRWTADRWLKEWSSWRGEACVRFGIRLDTAR